MSVFSVSIFVSVFFLPSCEISLFARSLPGEFPQPQHLDFVEDRVVVVAPVSVVLFSVVPGVVVRPQPFRDNVVVRDVAAARRLSPRRHRSGEGGMSRSVTFQFPFLPGHIHFRIGAPSL